MTSNNLIALISAFQMNKFYNIYEKWAISVYVLGTMDKHFINIYWCFTVCGA
jgi:hypothetical protein